MERQSNRAFRFCCVVFTLFLVVSSATDDSKPQSSDSDSKTTVDVVSKIGSAGEGQRTETKPVNKTDNPDKPESASDSDKLNKNCTADNKNDTECQVPDDRSMMTRLWDNLAENRNMLLRAIYVCIGVTGIVIVFFIIRAVGLRRRRNKSRKYGVITTRGDLEMEPLGQGDEDDEDYTVFEMNGRHK